MNQPRNNVVYHRAKRAGALRLAKLHRARLRAGGHMSIKGWVTYNARQLEAVAELVTHYARAARHHNHEAIRAWRVLVARWQREQSER